MCVCVCVCVCVCLCVFWWGRAWGLGCRVLGFRVEGVRFRVQSLGFGGLGFRV